MCLFLDRQDVFPWIEFPLAMGMSRWIKDCLVSAVSPKDPLSMNNVTDSMKKREDELRVKWLRSS